MAIVVACPKCGSTDAGEGDDSDVPPTLFRMVCGHCGNEAIVDDYEIKDEWNWKADTSNGVPKFVDVSRPVSASETVPLVRKP